jgi:hypothetical protein
VQLGRAHLFPATSVVETFEGQKANRGAAVPLASAHPSISGITLSDIAEIRCDKIEAATLPLKIHQQNGYEY